MLTDAERATKITALKNQLNAIRRASLKASREGRYMDVARLTNKAASINREIAFLDGGYIP